MDTQRKGDLCACETLLAEITSSGRLNTAWEAQVLSLLMNTAFVDSCRCLKDEAHGWSHPLSTSCCLHDWQSGSGAKDF